MAPKNFRTVTFKLFGKQLTIAGMAGPHNNKNDKGVDDPNIALMYLKKENRKVLIGLHESKDFTREAQQAGVVYHYLPIKDEMENVAEKGSPPPLSLQKFDAIYSIVKKATERGEQVSIHCGAGYGRTGTVLAALKLREILEKEENLEIQPEKTAKVVTGDGFNNTVSCTSSVLEAIQDVRKVDHKDHGESVETENDIKTLIDDLDTINRTYNI